MNYYFDAFKKFATFSGRANRKEFWMFILVNTIIFVALSILRFVVPRTLIVYVVYVCITFIPFLAITVRRLRDTNHSWRWVYINLIPIIGFLIFIYILTKDSVTENNEYDLNPAEHSVFKRVTVLFGGSILYLLARFVVAIISFIFIIYGFMYIDNVPVFIHSFGSTSIKSPNCKSDLGYKKKDGDVINVAYGVADPVHGGGANIRIIKDADPETFINICDDTGNFTLYSKDKNNVFYSQGDSTSKIGADPTTFTILRDGFSKDSKNVYYYDYNSAYSLDKETNEYEFVIDKNIVYGADQQTFTTLGRYGYAKDKNSVYRGPVTILGFNPQTFEILDQSYVKDKNGAYFVHLNDVGRIQSASEVLGADLSTFTAIEDTSFAKDKDNVYHALDKIGGIADLSSFVKIKNAYFKDKYNVYYYLTHFSVVPDINPNSVTSVVGGNIKDDKCIYDSYGKKVLDENGVCKDPNRCTEDNIKGCE